MLEFVKQIFVSAMMLFSCNALKCVSMSNQECKVRPEIVNINSDEPVLYPYSVKISKCIGSCNNISDPYAKICIPDVVGDANTKSFNLISRNNEARQVELHKNCKCECRLNATVCNNKQDWNEDKCRCECKKLIDKDVCDKEFIWNTSNCECDKSCDIREYLDYSNCKCRKKLIHKLVEECTENIDEKGIYLAKLHSERTISCICNSCTICIILFSLFFTINIGVATYFVYYKCMNDDNKTVAKEGSIIQTTIY